MSIRGARVGGSLRRRVSAIRAVAAGAVVVCLAGAPARAVPLPTGCAAADSHAFAVCGYVASARGEFVAARYGPWKIEVRDVHNNVKVAYGGNVPALGAIASVAGDTVVVSLGKQQSCESVPPAPPQCPDAGPVVATDVP